VSSNRASADWRLTPALRGIGLTAQEPSSNDTTIGSKFLDRFNDCDNTWQSAL